MAAACLFFITLSLYLVAAAATAFSWDLATFCLFRFLTGAGIGGEYSAVNSTIQEMIPARFRGWTDLALGGTFWIGGALGAGASIVLLDPARFNPEIGWRLGFFIGAALSLVILYLRLWIPESPRWLVIHGREAEAEKIAGEIEAGLRAHGEDFEDLSALKPMRVRPRTHTPLAEVFRTLFFTYRSRALVGLTLMASQAFFYNAIFFTYALVLTKFYAVPASGCGLVHPAVCARQCVGPNRARTVVRCDRQEADDRGNLRDLWHLACTERLAVRGWISGRHRADDCLGCDLLFCVARRWQRLSHRQRGLSRGNPGTRHRRVLFVRDGHRRSGRALSLRQPDTNRIAVERFLRLSLRGSTHGLRGGGGSDLGHRGGAKTA